MTNEGIQAQLGGLKVNLPVVVVSAVIAAIFTAGVLYTQLGNWQQNSERNNKQVLEKILDLKGELGSVSDRVNKLSERLDRDSDRANAERVDLSGKVSGLSSDMRHVNAQVEYLLERMNPDGHRDDGRRHIP